MAVEEVVDEELVEEVVVQVKACDAVGGYGYVEGPFILLLLLLLLCGITLAPELGGKLAVLY